MVVSPHLKNMLVKLDHLPRPGRGENKKCPWNPHPATYKGSVTPLITMVFGAHLAETNLAWIAPGSLIDQLGEMLRPCSIDPCQSETPANTSIWATYYTHWFKDPYIGLL